MIVKKGKQTIFGKNLDELLEDLTNENNFILKLVDSIPANMYFDKEIQEKIASEKHSLMDQKYSGIKRNAVELSAKNKHKRARLDPSLQKTVSQIQEELSKTKMRKKKKSVLQLPSIHRAANIEDLKKRFHDHLEDLKRKRNTSEAKVSQRKLKEQEKKLRGKKPPFVKVNETEMQANKAAANKKEEKVEEKPTYNKEGKTLYSKLDFSQDGVKEKKKSEFSGKDYKALLKRVEAKNQLLEQKKAADPEKAVALEEKEKWKKAILKSENVKVKDDPAILKKAVQRQEKIKKKKAKVWKERIDHTEEKKKQRQEKRKANLQKKKQEKVDKKMKRAKKKGRIFVGV